MTSTVRLDLTRVGPADIKRSLPVRHVQSEVPNHDQSRLRCFHDRQRQSHRLSLWLSFAKGTSLLLSPSVSSMDAIFGVARWYCLIQALRVLVGAGSAPS